MTSPLAALDPALTAPELEALATSSDPAMGAAVARHPNAPPALLGELAAHFPAEVLDNPALPLLRLADPGLLRGWSVAALSALVQQPQAPLWLRRHVAHSAHTGVQVLLAAHPALQPDEISLLVRHPAWLVRARVAARADLPRPWLAQLARDPDYGVRLAVAARTDLDDLTAQALRRDSSRFVRQVMEQTWRDSGRGLT